MAFGDKIQDGYGTSQSGDYAYIEFPQTATDGNLLVVVHFTGNTNSNCPDGYSEAVTVHDAGNDDDAAIYYKISDGTETEVTVYSNAGDENIAVFAEFEGPWEASPLDKTATDPAESDTSGESGTTAVTSQNDEVCVAGVTMRTGTVNYIDTWSNSYSEIHEPHTDYKGLGVSYLVQTSAAAQSTVGTLDGAQTHMGMIATFKKEVAAGPLSVSISQSMAIAESITRNLPLTRFVTESISIIESRSLSLPLTQVIIESLTVAESLGQTLPVELNLSEVINPTEAITALTDIILYLSEILNITDIATPLVEGIQNQLSQQETITIGELLDLTLPCLTEIAQSVDLQEYINALLTLQGDISESQSMQESIDADIEIEIDTIESLLITEQINALISGIIGTITQSITISEWIMLTLSGIAVTRRNRGLLLGVYGR